MSTLKQPGSGVNPHCVRVCVRACGADTILGSVGIASCGPHGEFVSIQFDVATGRLNFTARALGPHT